MTNPFIQFMTPQSGQQQAATGAKMNPFANGQQSSNVKAESQFRTQDFLKMILARLENSGDSTPAQFPENMTAGELSEADIVAGLKKAQQSGGSTFSTMGLGTLSQETLALLTKQFQNGEAANELSLITGQPGNPNATLESLLGLTSGKKGEGIFDQLMQQLNNLVGNSELQDSQPELFSKLEALQNMLNQQIASGEVPAPNGELRDMAMEINALMPQGYNIHDPKSLGAYRGDLAQFSRQLTSFLTPNATGAQTQNLQTKISPDLLNLLNGKNFAGFQSKGQMFGALQGHNGGNGMQALAAQLNSIEPGSQNPNNNFMQMLQSMAVQGMGQAFGPGQSGFSGSQLNGLFSASRELSFTGPQQQAAEAQQNALLSNNASPMATANAASVVTQAPQAGASHPATQVVAATLAKNAATNQARQMTLFLNPPELGRVHIKMELGRDNTMKARIASEKADTHTLLQRDSDTLQKALEEAGIDFDGNGLEFELANQDGAFDEFMKDRPGAGHADSDNGESNEDENLIETTMTWHVDPETGHARYNILA